MNGATGKILMETLRALGTQKMHDLSAKESADLKRELLGVAGVISQHIKGLEEQIEKKDAALKKVKDAFEMALQEVE
jgi:hypothetical protein